MGFFGRNDGKKNGGRQAAFQSGVVVGEEAPPPEIEPMVWKSDNPEFDANLASRALFWWLQPVFNRAAYLRKHNRALEQDDLAPLPTMDLSKSVEQRFETAYTNWTPPKSKKKKHRSNNHDAPPMSVVSTNSKNSKTEEFDDDEVASAALSQKQNTADMAAEAEAKRLKNKELESRLIRSLWLVCEGRMTIAGVIKFFNTCLQFGFPLLLQQILKFFEDTQDGLIPPDAPGVEKYRGYWLSVVLLIFIASKAMTESAYFHRVNRCGFQVRSAVSASVYTKSLRLANSEQQTTTLGEIVNLMQIDSSKLETFVPQIHNLWDGLFQIAGYMTILGNLLGWPCVIALVVMMFAGPVMGMIMGRLYGVNRRMVKFTDERVKTVNEAMQGIRCVKMYTWEESFAEEIGKSREQELESLRTVAILRGFARAYMTALPTVAAVLTFIVFAYATDRAVTASTLFSSIVAFDQLRFPLMFYPMALAQWAQAKVSVGRVAIFLGMKEVKEDGYTREETPPPPSTTGGEIIVEDATVYWRDPNIPITKDEGDDKSLDKSEHSTKANSVEEGELVYPKPVVRDVSLRIAPGELSAVVGRVGSGKSSLCSAILNETVLGEGSKIAVRGKVAYVAQSAWIMNKTIRGNILFGQPYDEKRYQEVLRVCQLKHDLSILDDGDMTEIGERGINLSGGQKQRISVARAAYSRAHIVILDDPLSALDPEVAGKLFEECIVKFMHGRTRLLVTNQLRCLDKCDTIVALGHGKVIEQGTYQDLMKAETGEVRRLLKEMKEAAEQQEEETKDKKSKNAKNGASDGKKMTVAHQASSSKGGNTQGDGSDAKTLTTKEEREEGAVKLRVYLKYIQAGGGYLLFAVVYFAFIVSAAITVITTAWISLWTSDANYERRSLGFYLGGYAISALLLGVFTFFRSYVLATFGVRASNKLHKMLLKSILSAPMSFFDTTPTGRILSRFSKDMYTIDQELSDYLDFVLFMTLSVAITIATIIFVTPWFGIALIPLIFVYIRVLNYFRQVSRETKRLESLGRSPVYAHFSETLGGLSTIRAYRELDHFIDEFETKLDLSTQAIYVNKAADRWLAVRLEMIGALVAGLAAIFSTQVVLSNTATGTGSNDQFSSLAGLSLTYAISITGMLNWVVRMVAQLEAGMNSAERVFYYSENIPQEAAMTSNDLEKEALLAKKSRGNNNSDDDDDKAAMTPSSYAVVASGGAAIHPPAEWPSKGEINLNHLLMRYRPETPLVLKGLDVTIAGGERIGVVGRTGSGKSSLLLCLLRIVEPELSNRIGSAEEASSPSYQPPLLVDGIDVLRIGLHDLRTKIGIIPQNPVLFSGTIRSNMDPFNDYTDDEIWSALDKCGMRDAVLEMQSDEPLNAPVAEYGDNLSQGQRQLLCLGRALLKKCKILLLDEATSSVDFETDREIQRTIRESFDGCTVLTIAHRVDTIMDSDRILVMKDGRAVEFAPPQELLENEGSLFADIVRHSQAEEDS